jgi:hypothetical protein
MSISNLWMLGPVVTSAGQINQIKDYSPDPGIETMLECSDGQVDYNFAAVMMQSPRLSFATTALARALGIAGINGLAIASAADFYFQKIAAGGTRSGGATSYKVTGTKGILVPTSITAEDKQPAQLNMDLVLISTDGTTAPIAVDGVADDADHHGGRPALHERPVSINGTTYDGIKSQRVDFGLELIVEHGSGEPYPTFVGIKKRKPTLSFKTTDVTALGSGGLLRGAGGDRQPHVLPRDRQERHARPAATTSHIKVSIDDGIVYAKTVGGGSEEDPQMTEITIEPTWDGTNDVIAISTGSAIT